MYHAIIQRDFRGMALNLMELPLDRSMIEEAESN